VDWHPDGTRLVTAGEDWVARVWDARTGELLHRLGDPRPPSRDRTLHMWVYGRWAAYGPEGSRILTRLRGQARVWDAETGAVLHELRHPGEGKDVHHAAWGPKGEVIRTSTQHRAGAETRLWDAGTGELLHVVAGGTETGQFESGFSPDGRLVATAVAGEGVCLFDVASGERVRTLPLESGLARWTWFSADGKHVLAVLDGFEVLVWSVHSGELVLEIGGGAIGMATSVCFGPDSRTLLMTDRRHRLRMIPLDLLAAAKRWRPRSPTPRERELYELAEPAAEVAEVEPPVETEPRPASSIVDREAILLARLARLEPEDPEFGDVYRRLAKIDTENRLYGQAEKHLRLALEAYARHGEEFREETLQAKHELGHVLERLRRHEEAVRILHEVAQAEDGTADAACPARVCLVSSMGREALARKDLATAVKRFRQAVDMSSEETGQESETTLGHLRLLATALVEAAEHEEAETILREVATAYRSLGEGTSGLEVALADLAVLLLRTGRAAEAGPVLQEATTLARRVHASRPLRLAQFLHDLGHRLEQVGQKVPALGLIGEAARLEATALGSGHPRAEKTNLCMLIRRTAFLTQQGQFPAVERDIRQILAIVERQGDHMSQATWQRQLARMIAQQGRHAEAIELLREGVADLRRLEVESPENAEVIEQQIAGGLATLGLTLNGQGEFEEAETVLRECLAIRERIIPKHVLRFNAMSLLGESLTGQKRFEEAKPLVVGGFEGMPEGDTRRGPAFQRVLVLYEAWGKPDEVEKWRAKGADETR
jgi:tetratricopeptide (TPR) repeat protein